MRPTESFWAGPDGDAYNARNLGLEATAIAFFARALQRVARISSVLEFGCGTGMNLQALGRICQKIELSGIEINEAAARAAKDRGALLYLCSALDWRPGGRSWDLVLSKGFLIHVEPLDLPRVYDTMFVAASRYLLIAEYFNPTPVEVEYRGKLGLLWKRDFAGELLDRFPTLRCVDYGFAWRRDPFPQDDLNWWLLEKR